jgi:hypothetical protein
MANEKRTLVRADPGEGGLILIQFTEQTLNAAGAVIATRHHRTSLEPGVSLDAQMEAVTAHMKQLDFTPAPAERIADLARVVAEVHTPARIAAFRAERAQRERKP